jgi:ribosomal protein S18 acetylase RimI-like enzyme
MISLKTIEQNDAFLIQQFLDMAGDSIKTFRYFASRPLEIINNHLVTVLLMDDNKPLGYGHLDKENETVWLGIAVCDFAKGKGYGKTIMQYLIEQGKNKGLPSIQLSVDKDNKGAISLYEKFGFKHTKDLNPQSQLMLLSF